MKAIVISLVILIFNISVAVVAHSGLFMTPPTYESSFEGRFGSLANYTNMSKSDLGPPSQDMFSILINTVSFDWILKYAAQLGLEEEFAPFVIGLNILLLGICAIAFIEMFLPNRELLGG